MKIIKLLTLLVLFSLQAGATGYSHNMFVAHKKLQAGKECRMDQIAAKKAGSSKTHVKHASVPRQPEVSFTQEVANKLSGIVTLNQRVIEEGPSSLFLAEDEKESDDSIVTKLVSVVKGIVYAFVGSSSFGKA
ncbi:hypothetical protein [Dyadobacter sp. NIV53]|uniref:hypothetical protein n=1 Tax=Dyadobacter sp. NIV53 TaxID=2861765 RepID=UPI001C84DBBE|nr:hypothetical protein [Dyadobacter sp. NIV53]